MIPALHLHLRRLLRACPILFRWQGGMIISSSLPMMAWLSRMSVDVDFHSLFPEWLKGWALLQSPMM